MRKYIVRRLLYMVGLLLAVSVATFVIIEIPPGDYLTSHVAQLELLGTHASDAEIELLTRMYGLDQPPHVRYLRWMANLLRGDLGRSFQWERSVVDLLAERLPLTIVLSLVTLLFTYAAAMSIGIYSATHQYSVFDYVFTVIGFAGLAIPNFLFALVLMYFLAQTLGVHVGGLFSPEFVRAPWSFAKALDLVKHLPIPVLVVGTAGTAGLIRVMRGCLLEELRKQYVITARTKGLRERTLLFRYPIRIALNPIVSTVGWVLPSIVSGETITAIVLNLPTTGPLLYGALLNQDMYLAGSIVMVLTVLTVVGTVISDVLLALLDPRIRYEK